MNDKDLSSLSLDELASLNKQLAHNEAESKSLRDRIATEVHGRLHLIQAKETLSKLTPEQIAALKAEIGNKKQD